MSKKTTIASICIIVVMLGIIVYQNWPHETNGRVIQNDDPAAWIKLRDGNATFTSYHYMAVPRVNMPDLSVLVFTYTISDLQMKSWFGILVLDCSMVILGNTTAPEAGNIQYIAFLWKTPGNTSWDYTGWVPSIGANASYTTVKQFIMNEANI